MGVQLSPLNLLVVFGSQLPRKVFQEEVQSRYCEACDAFQAPKSLGHPEHVPGSRDLIALDPRQPLQQRRRRPTAVPALDSSSASMMASLCMLSQGLYSGELTSQDFPVHNQSRQHMDLMPVGPFSPTTPSSPSTPPVRRAEVKRLTEDLCQRVCPGMVMVPQSIVDMDLRIGEIYEVRRDKVKQILIVMSWDNIAAFSVIASLTLLGAIYLWKICTRKHCSCRICRNQYRTLHLLGAGGYGSVYLVERLPELDRFVSKKILIQNLTEVDEYSREAKELVTLRHRHIVSYEDDFVHIEYGSLEPKTYFIIIMEYCPEGDLKEKIELDFMGFTEDWVRTVFAQLLQAVQYLHSKNVIHRDLKSQNVFLAYNGRVRLGDFGLCRHTQRAALGNATLTHAGTDCYMAPEMFSSSRYGKPADMWSLGCVLYELCTGQFMWELDGILGAMVMVDPLQVKKLVKVNLVGAVGVELKSMIKRLLHSTPANRPTATTCIRKKLFKRGFSLSRVTFGESLGETEAGATPEASCDTPSSGEPKEAEDEDAGESESEEDDEEEESSESSSDGKEKVQEKVPERGRHAPGGNAAAEGSVAANRQRRRRHWGKSGWR